MAQTNAKDSPKDEPKRKFSQEQYDMLKRCSDKKDMTEWNEWRKKYPKEDVLLEGANLDRCHLKGACFSHGYFDDPKRKNTYFTGKVSLQDAKLWDVNLQSAIFEKANLRGVELLGANLQGTNLSGANLKDAKLSRANLQDAMLFKANLEGAYLGSANLESAKLFGANLQGTYFTEANLKGADLFLADMKGAYLREANLNQAIVGGVRFDSRTRCIMLIGKDFSGSPVFKRFVEDTDYLEDFKRRHPVIYWIWFVLSDCGRSIGLWAAWSLAFAVFFAHVFYRLGPGAIEVAKLPWNFATLVYYSVVTFTTLGFGDVVPKTNAAAWWVMVEVITGYVMLGGLISIFANKLARRS